MNKLFNRMLIGFVLGLLIGLTFYPIIGAWAFLICFIAGAWVGGANL